jgi:putative chitinase
MLQEVVVIPVDAEVLRAIVPRFSGAKAEAQARIISAIDGAMQGTLAQYKINTRLRIAHFLAQIIHESAGLRATEEFASGEAYEGSADLGNVKRGDGPRYKGRGLLQLTGRANYKRLGDKLRIPLEEEPARAAEPLLSLTIACEYWTDRKINPSCDADDLITVTRKVNGGLRGLQIVGNFS